MKSSIVAVILGTLIVGCSSVGPAQKEYILQPQLHIKGIKGSKYADKTVKVSSIYGQRTLQSRDMFYITHKREQFAYSQSQWAQRPQEMLHRAVMDMLRESGVFGYVQGQKSKVLSDYLFETRVDDFSQNFLEDGERAQAKVTLTFTLLDAKKHTIVMSRTFSATKSLSSYNAEGGVEALTFALRDVLEQGARWMEESRG